MRIKYSILLLLIVLTPALMNAQNSHWTKKDLVFKDSLSIVNLQYVTDSLLILKFGETNFKDWYNSAIPWEFTKKVMRTTGGGQASPTSPIGLPYSYEIDILISFGLIYSITIPKYGSFQISTTDSIISNYNDISSWFSNMNSWSLIDQKKIRETLSKKDCSSDNWVLQFIDKHIFIFISGCEKEYLIDAIDGTIYKEY